MQSIHQVLSDCPACHVEAALVELYDPQQRVGVALEARCRLCGYEAEYGELRREGDRFTSVFEVMEALNRWSGEDGEEDVRQFTAANFQGLTPEQVAERVIAGLTVETGFDVIAWLFPNAGAMATEAAPRREEAVPRREDAQRWQMRPPERKPGAVISPTINRIRHTPTMSADLPVSPVELHPDAEGKALISVMMADGIAHPSERRWIEAYLRKSNQEMPPESEWRVWRPPETGFVKDPVAVVEAMRRVAMANGEIDGSEVRVIREYARAWQVPFSPKSLPRGGMLQEIRSALWGWFD
jgi:hypothetical protein